MGSGAVDGIDLGVSSSAGLAVESAHEGPRTILDLRGELDVATRGNLRVTLRRALATSDVVVLDLSGGHLRRRRWPRPSGRGERAPPASVGPAVRALAEPVAGQDARHHRAHRPPRP